MKIEMMCCTETLLQDIRCKEAKRKDVTQTYALALGSSDPTDWARVNKAIMARWSYVGLKYIKELAWSGKAFNDMKGARQ